MRYILYIFTLGLVFTSGMLVGNMYLPAHNATMAAAVSVPDVDRTNPALDQATDQQARKNLEALEQALSSCSVVVEEEKQYLFNQISLFLALQDFALKKAAYEAEIAKNASGTPPTSRFFQTANEYSLAKQNTERLTDTLFPPVVQSEVTEENPS